MHAPLVKEYIAVGLDYKSLVICVHAYVCVCVTERVVSIVCCLNGALSAWTDARPLICAVDELLGHLILPADKVQIFHQT